MNLKPFYLTLRKMGFRRVYPNMRDPLVYHKVYEETNRKLEVQLWRDGRHRVSFWQPTKYSNSDGFGRMSTIPTEFETVEGMLSAIEHERTREYETVEDLLKKENQK